MTSTAYVNITAVQAKVIDETGDIAPGISVLYTGVVVNNTTGNPIPIPGTGGIVFNLAGEIDGLGVGGVAVTAAAAQTAIINDVHTKWADATITVVII